MTQDSKQSGKEVCNLRMQLANAPTMAARAAPAAPQAPRIEARYFPTPQTFLGRIELS